MNTIQIEASMYGMENVIDRIRKDMKGMIKSLEK